MKKLTAGIFAGILTVVAAGAANAEVGLSSLTTKGYVDKITGTLTSGLDTAEGKITTAEGEIDTLQTTVGNATSGLVKSVAENKSAIDGIGDTTDGKIADALTDYTTTADQKNIDDAQDTLIDGKATKATTLAGYGITDASTTTAMNAAILDAKDAAIDAAATDATTKANNALAAAKSYTDEEITALDLAGNYAAKSVQTAVENETSGLAATKAIADAAVEVNVTQATAIEANATAIEANETAIGTKIPQPTADSCSKENAPYGCVLKAGGIDGITLIWEPIADAAE